VGFLRVCQLQADVVVHHRREPLDVSTIERGEDLADDLRRGEASQSGLHVGVCHGTTLLAFGVRRHRLIPVIT
jgi:hypothetical protein